MNVQKNCQTLKPLPSGWRWVKLREVCHLNPLRSRIDRPDGQLTTFIPMSAVDAMLGKIIKPELRPYGEIKKGYTLFTEGDVLFAKITPCMQNGKHAIAIGLMDGMGFGSTEFHVIHPNSDISSGWIHLFIRQPHILSAATAHFTGAVGQQRIPESFLANLEIPLPPLPEQKRIAAILNEQMAAVDKARAAAEAALEAAEALPAAYLRQVFPKPGQDLPSGWRWIKLGEVSRDNGQYGMSIKSFSQESGLPILGMGNIQNGAINWNNIRHIQVSQQIADRFKLEKDDILFNRTNSAELVGKSAVFNETKEALFASYIIRLRLRKDLVDPYFICRFINSKYGRFFIEQSMTRAIGQVNISASTIMKMPIPIPSLTEQKRIAAILDKQLAGAEQLRTDLEAQLHEINALPAALLKRAFNGEL